MKILNRIIFALVASVGLMMVYSLSDAATRSAYLAVEGQKAIDRNDLEYFMSVRFYRQTPLYDEIVTQEEVQLHILIYEVAYIHLVEEQYFVEDGIFVLIHQIAGTGLPEFFNITFDTVTDLSVLNLGYQVLDLPLFSAMDQESSSPMYKKSRFEEGGVNQDINSLSISFEADQTFLEIPVSIIWQDFTLKTELNSYLVTHNTVPENEFGNVSIAPAIIVDTTSVVVRNIVIYVVAVLVFTVVVFTMKKKRMGRKQPTEGVKEDVKRLAEKESGA